MTSRSTIRTVATLVASLAVVTMFAGVGAAAPLGIDTGLADEGSQSGSGGGGAVDISTGQGPGVNGSAAVGVDQENQSLTVAADGQGGPNGDDVGGGVECTFTAAPENPCEVDSPGGGGGPGLPSPPGDGLPSPPGDGLPSLPSPPTDQLPAPGGLLSL